MLEPIFEAAGEFLFGWVDDRVEDSPWAWVSWLWHGFIYALAIGGIGLLVYFLVIR